MTMQLRPGAIGTGLVPALTGLVFGGCEPTDGPVLQYVDAGTTASAGPDGALADGTLADGALTDGALADGALAEGALLDGTLADATLADGSASASGDANDGALTVSLDSDGHNCGSRGHDCLGGACIAGQCQPVLLATASTPYATVVDDTRVYFATGDGDPGPITSIAKDGSDPRTMVTGIDQCHSMYLRGTTLFWTEIGTPGRIGSVNTDGTNPIVLAQTGQGPAAIVVDEASIYALDVLGFRVLQLPLTGEPDGGSPNVLTTGWLYPYAMTQDSRNLYWTARGNADGELGTTGPADGGVLGKIVMMPKDGSSAPVVIADNLGVPMWIAVDATGVYWTDALSGVMYLPAGSSVPVLLAASSDVPYMLTLDGNDLYFTTVGKTATNGTLQRMPKDGSATPVVLVQNLIWPSQIAVDDAAIYWANTHGSTVMKLAK